MARTVHTFRAKSFAELGGQPWELITGILKVFGKSVVEMASENTKGLAIWMRNEVKSRVYNQTFDHTPLNERYLEWKKKTKLDTRILVATNDYIRLIEATPTASAESGNEAWAVGPPEGVHQPSGLRYKDLAKIHEFGSKKQRIPPRPVWRPVWSVAVRRGQGLLRNIGREAMRTTRRYARSKGRA